MFYFYLFSSYYFYKNIVFKKIGTAVKCEINEIISILNSIYLCALDLSLCWLLVKSCMAVKRFIFNEDKSTKLVESIQKYNTAVDKWCRELIGIPKGLIIFMHILLKYPPVFAQILTWLEHYTNKASKEVYLWQSFSFWRPDRKVI